MVKVLVIFICICSKWVVWRYLWTTYRNSGEQVARRIFPTGRADDVVDNYNQTMDEVEME